MSSQVPRITASTKTGGLKFRAISELQPAVDWMGFGTQIPRCEDLPSLTIRAAEELQLSFAKQPTHVSLIVAPVGSSRLQIMRSPSVDKRRLKLSDMAGHTVVLVVRYSKHSAVYAACFRKAA
jgi:hypothetical protein